jgi:hypothetical protein
MCQMGRKAQFEWSELLEKVGDFVLFDTPSQFPTVRASAFSWAKKAGVKVKTTGVRNLETNAMKLKVERTI